MDSGVFYYDLLINKLHYIDYKKYTASDNMHGTKYMLHIYQNLKK